MQPLSLPLSLNLNRALNADHTTALRSLSLVQGESYGVNVLLFSGSTQVAPAVDNFAFLIRNTAGTDLVSVTGITPSGAGYYFPLSLVSPVLGATSSYKGYCSFNADGQPEIMEPFSIHIAATQGNGTGNASNYVASVNGLSAAVTIAGLGSVVVSQNGQTISISGSGSAGGQATGDFYPNSNPSGYLTPSGNGISLSNVVHTSGDQTISGVKTFHDRPIFTNAAINGTASIGAAQVGVLQDSNGHNDILLGAAGVAGYVANEPWHAQGTLTKIIPGSSDTPAAPAVATLSSNWGNLVDSDTVTINVDGTSIVFEFSKGAPDDFGRPPAFTLEFGSWDGVTPGSFNIGTHVGSQPFSWSTGSAGNIPSDLSLYGAPDESAAGWSYTVSGTQITFTFNTNEVADMSGLEESVSGTTVSLVSDDAGAAPGPDVQPGNVAVTVASSDDTTTGGNLVTAINTAFSGVATAAAINSTDLTITTANTGGSEQIHITSSTAGQSISSSDGYGNNLIPGSSESGTRFTLLKGNLASSNLKTFVTEATIYVDTTPWDIASIEIGYWDGATFTTLVQLPQSSLSPGVHTFPTNIQFTNSSCIAALYNGMALDIVALTTNGSSSPEDENVGGDATIYLRGYYAHS